MRFFFHVRLRTYAQYASMNAFTCSEHSVRMSKIRSTGNQLLVIRDRGVELRLLMAQSLVIFFSTASLFANETSFRDTV